MLVDAPEMPSDEFRRIMRSFASTVSIVTTCSSGGFHGMTATAICSVSAMPSCILIVVNRSTRTHPFIAKSKSFVVNFLNEGQEAIAERFAGKLDNQFDGVPFVTGVCGCPIITDAAGHLECTVKTEVESDSHTVFIARVVRGNFSAQRPLIYYDGSYGRISIGVNT